MTQWNRATCWRARSRYNDFDINLTRLSSPPSHASTDAVTVSESMGDTTPLDISF